MLMYIIALLWTCYRTLLLNIKHINIH